MARERSDRLVGTRAQQPSSSLSIAEIRQLITLMNASDIDEITLDREAEGLKLVLRKPPLSATLVDPDEAGESIDPSDDSPHPPEKSIEIGAPLVGVFRASAKPGGHLLKPGDVVREGQVVAAVEALNVWNEVETPEAGRVVEVLAADGQPVEYGQPLLIIERSRA